MEMVTQMVAVGQQQGAGTRDAARLEPLVCFIFILFYFTSTNSYLSIAMSTCVARTARYPHHQNWMKSLGQA